jgi:type IV pilus assembly protein PilW
MSAKKLTALPHWRHQRGLTLTELMVSMVLGMIVILAATSLFLSSKSVYFAQDDAVSTQESGRHAVELIARALRQAAYDNWDSEAGAVLADGLSQARIIGLDAYSLKSNRPGLVEPVKRSVNGSDVLGIRFAGAGKGAYGDATILNCAGFGIPAVRHDAPDSDRGWSIFYVAEDAGGEPELRCKYRGKTAWASVAIARGVESFQVLYGLDADADGAPNQYLTASELDALDDSHSSTDSNNNQQAAGWQDISAWKKIVAVKVAMLIRGTYSVRADTLDKRYDLFGTDYAELSGQMDKGVRIEEAAMPIKSRNRIRKIFTATVRLRNQAIHEEI